MPEESLYDEESARTLIVLMRRVEISVYVKNIHTQLRA